MARIAFFIEELPPNDDAIARFGWELIRSLADQQHEIRVFSTYHENTQIPESHPGIEIVRPLKTWGFTEMPKLLPMLVSFRPEIIHLIQPHGVALKGWSNLMTLLPALAPMLGGALTVTSFYDINAQTLARHRLLLAGADALTVSNEKQRQTVEAFFKHRPHPVVEVVPISVSFRPERETNELIWDSTAPSHEVLEHLRERFPETVLVPGPVDQHLDPLATFSTIAAILRERPAACAAITGGWGSVPVRIRHAAEETLFDAGVGDRVVLTGPLSPGAQNDWIRKSQCVLIAPLDESRLAFTQHLRHAQSVGAAIVLSEAQAGLDPIAWRDGENAFVRERSIEGLRRAVTQCLEESELRERIRRNNLDFSKTQVLDHPGNIMSRLYTRVRQPGRERTRSP